MSGAEVSLGAATFALGLLLLQVFGQTFLAHRPVQMVEDGLRKVGLAQVTLDFGAVEGGSRGALRELGVGRQDWVEHLGLSRDGAWLVSKSWHLLLGHVHRRRLVRLVLRCTEPLTPRLIGAASRLIMSTLAGPLIIPFSCLLKKLSPGTLRAA